MDIREALEYFKEQGKITAADIEEVLGPSQELQDLATTMHQLLCYKDHDKTCNFRIEDTFVDRWKKEHHALWLKEARDFLALHKITDGEGLTFLATALTIVKNNHAATLDIVARCVEGEEK